LEGYISKYFTWAEAVGSQTAARRHIDNSPDNVATAAIENTAQHMDRVRELLGHPILVSSWYRSLKLNTAIGSKPTSQHCRGEAVDFICPAFGTPADIFWELKPSSIDYDQLILELGRWIHISFNESPRRQALEYDGKTYVVR
jgi:hypothetical protein